MSLSDSFLEALIQGHLTPIRWLASTDATLSPEIREDTLSLYYRGGRILKCQRTTNSYKADFDNSYCNYLSEGSALVGQIDDRPCTLNTEHDVARWIEIVPYLKAAMDNWFTMGNRNLESEYQQLLVRENNIDLCKSTDYFICDTERVEEFDDNGTKYKARFDFVGVHWPSNGPSRRNTSDLGFVIGEMKYGDGAVAGHKGLVDHLRAVQQFLEDRNRLCALKDAMRISFNQKRRLKFIRNQNDICTFESSDSAPMWLLVIANHDPEASRLKDELAELSKDDDSSVRIRVAVSNFMGYGLYDQGVYNIDDFLRRFNKNVFHRGINNSDQEST